MIARREPPASGIRAIFDRAAELERAGRRVLRLDVGRPVWKLPPGAQEAVVDAVAGGENHYTANRGIAELRAAIADELARSAGRSFDPETEVVVTAGAMEAVTAAALAFTGPGDEVVVPEPAWSHYAAAFELAGATVVPLPLDPATGFAIDPDALTAKLTARTRLVVVNTPGNPTGAVQPRAALERVAAIARERDLFVLADDVYGELALTAEHVPIAGLLGDHPGLLQVGSLSKSDAMTGWRIGWVAAPAAAADVLNRVHTYLTTCATSIAQYGALAALRHPGRAAYLAELRAAFAERLELWSDTLSGLPGVTMPVAPEGAIYLFPRIEHRGMTGRELCDHLLEAHGVAVVPGDVFGAGYESHVRISYGADLDVQRQASRAFAGILGT